MILNGEYTLIENILSKEELSIINKRSLKYDLASAEKDYFLAVVLAILYRSRIGSKLVFKGGTAIHHCYLPQYRFSEDLDFTAIDQSISLEELRAVFEKHDFLSIKTEYTSKTTLKIGRLMYSGPLGLPNSLKVEVDFFQNVVLPARKIEYKNVWGVKASVMAMDPLEIAAEKIRACAQRSRYRDFYDLYLMMEKFKFDIKEVLLLVRRKEVRSPISPRAIKENWNDALIERTGGIARIYYSREIDDKDLGRMVNSLNFAEIISSKPEA